uniref:Uncharacterized protein n=1 Tax=Siphoviridae sp. ctDo63 TaxID=2823571 RepID=A0A8S5LGI0_9CAUD|nr:MAG TPA: hypothetical protein [Siphoviridae sp. ctDo63]
MALGSVSIPPFTRAELVRLINQKSYPDGKLVWSATVDASSTTNVPDDVDYITISVGDSPVKMARGCSAQWTSTAYYGPLSSMREYPVYHTAKFSGEGTLTLSWSCSANIGSGGTYQLTGYHYY